MSALNQCSTDSFQKGFTGNAAGEIVAFIVRGVVRAGGTGVVDPLAPISDRISQINEDVLGNTSFGGR